MITTQDLLNGSIEQDSFDAILQQDDFTPEKLTKLWNMIGFPYKAEVVPIAVVLQNLASVALGQLHPLGAKMSRDELEAFLDKQGFSTQEIVKVIDSLDMKQCTTKKNFASLLTRLCKIAVGR